jgi:leukotriene-A4 hydrolase
MVIPKDIHSFSNPQQVSVQHLDLNLTVLFDERILKGSATLTLQHHRRIVSSLVLDTRDLRVDTAEASVDNARFYPVAYSLGPADRILGQSLTVEIPPEARFVRIHYSTSPTASGLQWLTPEQTEGGKYPYLFSQSQAIHARSWIPLQDSPSVRITYAARIRTPRTLTAVMGAERKVSDTAASDLGEFRFEMHEPIPSYLIALAVGDIKFQATGTRTGVFAEPSVLAAAASEFEDTEKMLESAEKIFGPYLWGRFDILVMPPSFPFGGMENPRVSFVTPTILAGDKSLVSLISHELAHSWSGNLVTNATWSDFWLNEGFTVYCERRIVEEVYGRAQAEMEAALGRHELEDQLKTLAIRDTILHVDLTGRDPDEGMTPVPYEKGALFLVALERELGRDGFDRFLRQYFTHFSFQSVTTAQAVEYMTRNLRTKIDFRSWIEEPGLRRDAPVITSPAFGRVMSAAREWVESGTLPSPSRWSSQEWLYFLRALPPKLAAAQLVALDRAFSFTRSANYEILNQWLIMSVRNSYTPAYDRLREFLTSVGRRKYIKPLYEELSGTADGKYLALQIYEKARPHYHPISQSTIDGLLRDGVAYARG